MGAFYGAILVRTSSSDEKKLDEALNELARTRALRFYIAPPRDGFSTIYPSNRGQDWEVSHVIAQALAADTVHFMVNDSDTCDWRIYRASALVDQSRSPRLLAELFGQPSKETLIAQILADTKYVVEEDRLRKLARTLGLKNVATSYEDVLGGETDDLTGWREFRHIPSEKETSDREKQALDALRSSGVLFTDVQGLREEDHHGAAIKVSPARDGFIVAFDPGAAETQTLVRIGPGYATDPQRTKITFTGPIDAMHTDAHQTRVVVQKRQLFPPPPRGETSVFELDQELELHASAASEARHLEPTLSGDGKTLLTYAGGKLSAVDVDSDREHAAPIAIDATRDLRIAAHPNERAVVIEHGTKLAILTLDGDLALKAELIIRPSSAPGTSSTQERKMIETALEEAISQADLPQKLRAEGLEALLTLPPRVEPATALLFSRDGTKLFRATYRTIATYAWSELKSATNELPKPIFERSLSAGDGSEQPITAIAHDTDRDLLLLAGANNISALHTSGPSAGELISLLALPIEGVIGSFALSGDNRALAIVVRAGFDHPKQRPRLLVCSHPALIERLRSSAG